MSKNKCITKEKVEEMYKTDEENETRMDLSFGEDLESFIERIKNGEIKSRELTFNKFFTCLLNKEERKKLEQKDEDFIATFYHARMGHDADVPEAEWKESESNLKFSLSLCTRDTHFIDAS